MFFERQVVLYSWKKPLGPTATATAAARIIAKRKLELQDAGSGQRLVLVPGSSSRLPSWVVSRGRYTTRKHATRRNQRKKYSHWKWWVQFFMSPPSYTGYHCCAASAAQNCKPLLLSLSLSVSLCLTHSCSLSHSLSLSWAHFSKAWNFVAAWKKGFANFKREFRHSRCCQSC